MYHKMRRFFFSVAFPLLILAENGNFPSYFWQDRTTEIRQELQKDVVKEKGQEEKQWKLSVAIASGDPDWVREALQNGGQVNLRGPHGVSYLDAAIFNGFANKKMNIEVIQILIDSGADPNMCDERKNQEEGLCPLGTAIILAPDPDVVHLLLKSGAKVNHAGDLGITPLMHAARGVGNSDERKDRAIKITEVLLEYGAEIDARDDSGQTALIHAAQYGNDAKIIYVLLRAGANKKTKDQNGLTAFDYASKNFDLKNDGALLAALKP